MYKIVAIDMDGTLLNDQKIIPQANIDTIKKAKEKGVHVVIATGRPIEGINQYLPLLHVNGITDYVCAFNGAFVCDEKKNTISEKFLTGRDLKRLYELALKLNVNIHAFTKEKCITPKMSEYSQLEGDLNNIPVYIVDFNEIQDDLPIIKMMLVDPEPILEKAIKMIPDSFYEDYMVVRSAPFFLEFLNKDCDKWVGIQQLAKYLNIKQEDIICIGDAGNDALMIKNAGLGVAMDNAFPEVKEYAKYITDDNNNSGVAKVIDLFILNNKKSI